ncbi:hypothetical protein M885DRAFT_623050 [Pelagophyceae sp. CCMP2097]|nr:hypothetical protein M885DRAFT_623050 [Pelagophyceae sp. CCMP2097]
MTANKCGTADYTKAGGWADGEAAKKSYCKVSNEHSFYLGKVVVYNFSGADLRGANFSGANFGSGSIIMGPTAHVKLQPAKEETDDEDDASYNCDLDDEDRRSAAVPPRNLYWATERADMYKSKRWKHLVPCFFGFVATTVMAVSSE